MNRWLKRTWALLKVLADALSIAQFLQWLGVATVLGGAASWVAASLLRIGVPWNVLIGVGVGLVAVGTAPRLWHRLSAALSPVPRFELVSSELRCTPPLARSPVHETRDCTVHAVFVNRGAPGNAVAVVRYVGIGRAGSEYPSMERRAVIPTTQTQGFAEIACHLGAYPPIENQHGPQIDVIHTVKTDQLGQSATRTSD